MKINNTLAMGILFVSIVSLNAMEREDIPAELGSESTQAPEDMGPFPFQELATELQQEIILKLINEPGDDVTPRQAYEYVQNVLQTNKEFEGLNRDESFQNALTRAFYERFIPGMTIDEAFNFAQLLANNVHGTIMWDTLVQQLMNSTSEADRSAYFYPWFTGNLVDLEHDNDFVAIGRRVSLAIFLNPVLFNSPLPPENVFDEGDEGVYPLPYLIALNLPVLLRTVLQDPRTSETQLNPHIAINIQNEEGRTALWTAVASNNAELVRMLLEYGANPLITDNNGNNVLYYVQQEPRVAADITKALTSAEQQWREKDTELEEKKVPTKKRRLE